MVALPYKQFLSGPDSTNVQASVFHEHIKETLIVTSLYRKALAPAMLLISSCLSRACLCRL